MSTQIKCNFFAQKSICWAIKSAHTVLKLTTKKQRKSLIGLYQNQQQRPRVFLGLVRYLADLLPILAEYTGILTELMTKEAEKAFPPWTDHYQSTFDSVKNIVISCECLTTIDLSKLPEYKIFVTTDASNRCSGAILSFGKSWSSA